MALPKLKDLVLRDTPFAELMNKRVYNVLLIATKYDAFMLEDDGRVAAAAEVEEQHPAVFVPPDKFGVSFRGGVPALVLHKGLVGAQVDLHRTTADA